MLAAPPAAAITYVKESSGLDPSVYGGGGSPSSALLLGHSPFLSAGSAALVSTSAELGAVDENVFGGSNGGVGAKAGSETESVSVIDVFMRSKVFWGGKYRDENGGGRGGGGAEEDDGAKKMGECGGGSV